MQAIKEIIHGPEDWFRLIRTLPSTFIGRDLEVIIIPAEDVTSVQQAAQIKSMLGSLHEYSDPEKFEREPTAWKDHVSDE